MTTIRTEKETPTHNSGLAKVAVHLSADTFVQGESSALRIKFNAKTPRHRKPPNRKQITIK